MLLPLLCLLLKTSYTLTLAMQDPQESAVSIRTLSQTWPYSG